MNDAKQDALPALRRFRVALCLCALSVAAVFCAWETRRRPLSASTLPSLPGEIRLDVNVAGVEELSVLPGVGRKTAESIVADRAANGPFTCVEDVRRVKGIGPAKWRRFERWIEAGPMNEVPEN